MLRISWMKLEGTSKAATIVLASLVAVLFLTAPCRAFQVKFEPRATLSETYTDNVNLTRDKEEDFITTLKAGFALSLLGQKSGVSLSYDPSYSWYQNNQEDNTFNHDARLDAWQDLTRHTRLFLNDTLIYSEDPYLEDVAGSRTGRDPYLRNTATVGGTHRFGRYDSVLLQYTHRTLKDYAPNADDYTQKNPSFSLSWWPTFTFGLDAAGEYTRGEYELQDDFNNYDGNVRLNARVSRHLILFAAYRHTVMEYDKEPGNNYDTYYPSIGLDYEFMKEGRMTISGGYLITERERGNDDERFVANGDLEKTWRLKRGALRLTGAGGYDESFYDFEDLGLRVYYSTGVTLTYAIYKKVDTRLWSSYRIDDYINTPDERQDRTTSAGLGLTWKLLRQLTAALDYSYRMRDSSDPDYEYQENRVSLSLTMRPRHAFRLN